MFMLNDRVMDNVTGEKATVTYSSSDTFDVWYDKDVHPSQGWGQNSQRFTKITEIDFAPSVQLMWVFQN